MSRHDTSLGSNAPHSSFLRGGQVFIHTARMSLQILRLMAVLCVITTMGTAFYLITQRADPVDQQNWITVNMARVNTALGSNREYAVARHDRTHVRMPADRILADPYTRQSADRFVAFSKGYIYNALGIGGALFLIMAAIFIAHGRRLGSDRTIRGALLITAKELTRRIKAFNRQQAKLYKVRKYKPYEIAGVPYPFRAETTHTLLAGTTGSGKSQVMLRLMEQIRERGDRAIVYDKMRTYVPPFYDPERGDQILNPLDQRCAGWSPFADARSHADFRQMAAALIQSRGNDSDPVWAEWARLFFTETAYKLHRMNKRSVSDLMYLLLRAPLRDVADFLADTNAAATMGADTPKQSQGIRATLLASMASMQALADSEGDKPVFSIRKWVDEDSPSCLFLTSRSDQHETIRPLITTWMEVALSAIMAQTRDPDRTIWILLDELPSLNQLPSLQGGLAEGRQFGAAFVLGIQQLSQLKSIYKDDIAHTIMGLARTKIILNLPDPDTAEYAARTIGKTEVQRAQRGVSFGASNVRDGASYTLQDKLDFLVLPDQLMRLPNLSGYIVPATDLPSATLSIKYRAAKEKHPGFIERHDDTSEIDWSTVFIKRRANTTPGAGEDSNSTEPKSADASASGSSSTVASALLSEGSHPPGSTAQSSDHQAGSDESEGREARQETAPAAQHDAQYASASAVLGQDMEGAELNSHSESDALIYQQTADPLAMVIQSDEPER